MKYFIILFYCVTHLVSGQFNITGTLIGFQDEKIELYSFRGFNNILLDSDNLGEKGNFNFRVDKEYKGVLLFRLKNLQFYVFSDNEDIRFEIDSAKKLYNVITGRSQKVFSYLAVDKKVDEAKKIMNENKELYINYYLDLRQQLDLVYVSKQIDDLNEKKDSLLYRLIHEGDNLFHSDLLDEVIEAYLLISNKTKIDDYKAVEHDAVKILNEVGIDTERGQLFASYMLDKFLNTKYHRIRDTIVKLVDCSKCELKPFLKDLITAYKVHIPGTLVPEIEFEDKEQKKKSLHDFKVKFKILMFWSSECGHCVKAMPKIIELYPEFKKMETEIFSISGDVDQGKYEEFSKEHTWPKYVDFKSFYSPIFIKFGITSTPTFLLIDQNNKFVKNFNNIESLKKFIEKN